MLDRLLQFLDVLVWVAVSLASFQTTAAAGGRSSLEALDARNPPVLMISFADHIPDHNMGIACDGIHYYTISGGDDHSDWSQINTYDLDGHQTGRVSVGLCGRAIFYNPVTALLYVKPYGPGLYAVNPNTGATSLVFWDIFDYWQSSPALTPDGRTILEFQAGHVRFLDFATGEQTGELDGLFWGQWPSSEAIGTDGTRIFTWDGSHVHVYDMGGQPIEDYLLPQGTYGFSLKYVNSLLFASDDGHGGTGMWYGYAVGGNPVPVTQTTWGRVKSLYR
jgi:hypothetical protein